MSDLSPIMDAEERAFWLENGPYRVTRDETLSGDPTPFRIVDANGLDAGYGNFGERLGAEFCCASLNREEGQASAQERFRR